MDLSNKLGNGIGCTDYDDDILEMLKESEANRKEIKYIAPQLQYRTSVVQLIRNVGKEQSYRRTTIHLAIHLLDVFMSSHTIPKRRLKLVALTCLYVACKVEENDSNVPSPGKLNSFVRNVYRPLDFLNLEVRMLKFFNWHLTIPSAATFLDIFDLHSFDRKEYAAIIRDNHATVPSSFDGYVRRINQTAGEILDASLRNYTLSQIRPSVLAAACLAAARFLTQNVSIWTDRLTRLTGYTENQLLVLYEKLIFDVTARSSTPLSKYSFSDAGYLSAPDDGSSSRSRSSTSSESELTDESDSSSDTSIGKRNSENRYKRTCLICGASIVSSVGNDERGGKRRKLADNDWSWTNDSN
uniref:Cyclin-like domain-containing protein n=1 Tax=Anopheles farauti TaxID=69004 RepID=A0A182QNY8_9DIPT